MKISRLECLHADSGCRNFDYLKITTDDGLTGWSEFNESFGGMGVSAVIEQLAPTLLGRDPRAYEAIGAMLYAVRRQASGGLVQQALGAIENALLDLKAKSPGDFRSARCWAGRCETGYDSTGPIAEPTGWPGTRRWASLR